MEPHQSRRSILAGFALCLALSLCSCQKGSSRKDAQALPSPTPTGVTRSYLMGFTPWPYAITQEAVDWTWQEIQREGDLISEHWEEGVPWPEALSGAPFDQNYTNTLIARRAKHQAGKKVILSVNAMNVLRDGLADYRGASNNMPLAAPWNGYAFNHPNVKTAYLNYVRRMVEIFHPDYLLIGIEANLLMRNSPALWPAYRELLQFTYAEIKKTVSIPVMVSIESIALLGPTYSPADPVAQAQALADILPCSDILGISLHPFMSSYLAESVPADIFDRVYGFVGNSGKKVAFTEASYPAQVWSVVLGGQTLVFNGSQQKQDDFVSRLFEAADAHGSPFVLYFAIRDYDQLWEASGRRDDLLTWRDTGFYDENGAERTALQTWRGRLARPLALAR